MVRVGRIFDTVFTPANLYAAYMEARRCKRGKRSCLQFERRLASNLDDLHAEIHAGAYAPRKLYSFAIADPKPRVISAPAFRDLVVQHAIYRVVYPIFDATFIHQSYACRVGYGAHAASDCVQSSLRKCSGGQVTIHLDVRRFFYSIDAAILRVSAVEWA
jgi:retron-type reverse transcriptase